MWWHTLTQGGEVKGKLANAVGSQYHSHYLGTRCIQDYYRWCRTPRLPVVDWTYAPHRADLNGLVRFARKTKCGFCACTNTFQTQSTTESSVWKPKNSDKHSLKTTSLQLRVKSKKSPDFMGHTSSCRSSIRNYLCCVFPKKKKLDRTWMLTSWASLRLTAKMC